MSSQLKYQIAISLIPGVGPVTAKKLITYLGDTEAIFKEKQRNLIKIPGIGKYIALQINKTDALQIAEKELEFISKNNINTAFYTDDDYPNRLKNCEDSPIIFFYKGDVNFNAAKIIAVVGTRNPSEYGKKTAEEIIKELAQNHQDIIIVSGLADGIDTLAHRVALKNNIKTIAVMGTPLNTIYPAANRNIAKEIMQNGALVTEFLTSDKLDKSNFVKRNRIIAGMSDVSLVVEAGEKSGTLITANYANSYNRDVVALPGRVSDVKSKGCNNLIKSNKAQLIENAKDIEYLLNWDNNNENKNKQKKLFVEMNETEKLICSILEKNEKTSIDIISLEASLSISQTSVILLEMEFKGIVNSLPGKIFSVS